MQPLSKRKIMGILNVTPDSFYDGGKYSSVEKAIERAAEMVTLGVDIIDVGGESTRPGAPQISLEEELDRVVPVVDALSSRFDVTLSVDTTKAVVAQQTVDAGASIINDVSGMTFDRGMVDVVSRSEASVILMHTSGTPDEMMQKSDYSNVVDDVSDFLIHRAHIAEENGVAKERIIVDPGIGFDKNLEDNYRLLAAIPMFLNLGYPLLIGLSRKSLIGAVIGNDEDRLVGTVTLNSFALFQGAQIIRVHDVKEHIMVRNILAMFDKVEAN